ncbi:polyisoprenoid-binding protein [Tersicoccus phoenicis]|uniref:Polyisoprenoid-binding protein n=1 Tax=Tersicoccus phoenicis TaxID=554083 RepID=A0A1R1LHI8_9MICC|nr:YceI family protein [Tersicoccus phoenicis]OMH26980.1 polyisoprenoid-binding protein [Tersicoccus phoenicis]
MTTSIEQINGLTQGVWTADVSHSHVAWSVRHAGISKVRGTFDSFTSTLTVGETLEQSVVVADIDVASVNSKDENRDGHVRGTDFFDAENFPTMSFRSTSVSGTQDDLTITGELTIRGTTQEVTLTGELSGVATDPFGITRTGVTASTSISRKAFGITWNAALEAGGVMVSDKVTIDLDVEYTAPQAA